jgi:hypothetical protein
VMSHHVGYTDRRGHHGVARCLEILIGGGDVADAAAAGAAVFQTEREA